MSNHSGKPLRYTRVTEQLIEHFWKRGKLTQQQAKHLIDNGFIKKHHLPGYQDPNAEPVDYSKLVYVPRVWDGTNVYDLPHTNHYGRALLSLEDIGVGNKNYLFASYPDHSSRSAPGDFYHNLNRKQKEYYDAIRRENVSDSDPNHDKMAAGRDWESPLHHHELLLSELARATHPGNYPMNPDIAADISEHFRKPGLLNDSPQHFVALHHWLSSGDDDSPEAKETLERIHPILQAAHSKGQVRMQRGIPQRFAANPGNNNQWRKIDSLVDHINSRTGGHQSLAQTLHSIWHTEPTSTGETLAQRHDPETNRAFRGTLAGFAGDYKGANQQLSGLTPASKTVVSLKRAMPNPKRLSIGGGAVLAGAAMLGNPHTLTAAGAYSAYTGLHNLFSKMRTNYHTKQAMRDLADEIDRHDFHDRLIRHLQETIQRADEAPVDLRSVFGFGPEVRKKMERQESPQRFASDPAKPPNVQPHAANIKDLIGFNDRRIHWMLKGTKLAGALHRQLRYGHELDPATALARHALLNSRTKKGEFFTPALNGLIDWMQEHPEHWLAKAFNWENVGRKLDLDSRVYHHTHEAYKRLYADATGAHRLYEPVPDIFPDTGRKIPPGRISELRNNRAAHIAQLLHSDPKVVESLSKAFGVDPKEITESGSRLFSAASRVHRLGIRGKHFDMAPSRYGSITAERERAADYMTPPPHGDVEKFRRGPVRRMARLVDEDSHLPFAQTIAENPEDDAPKLVYADWLEDHDDPRHQLVRMSVKQNLQRGPEADKEWHPIYAKAHHQVSSKVTGIANGARERLWLSDYQMNRSPGRHFVEWDWRHYSPNGSHLVSFPVIMTIPQARAFAEQLPDEAGKNAKAHLDRFYGAEQPQQQRFRRLLANVKRYRESPTGKQPITGYPSPDPDVVSSAQKNNTRSWAPKFPEFAVSPETGLENEADMTGNVPWEEAPSSSHVAGWKLTGGGFVRKFYGPAIGAPEKTSYVLTVGFRDKKSRGLKSLYEYYFPDKATAENYLNSLRSTPAPGYVVHALINAGVPYKRKYGRAEAFERPQRFASNLAGSLPLFESPQQKLRRQLAEKILHQAGLHGKAINVLHDFAGAVQPNVMQRIQQRAEPEKVIRSAAAFGQLAKQPGMLVFSHNPMGMDRLYSMRLNGSGEEVQKSLDDAGIAQRILIPHTNMGGGFTVVMHDPGGNTIRDKVGQLAMQHNTTVNEMPGQGEILAGADPGKVRAAYRKETRKPVQAGGI